MKVHVLLAIATAIVVSSCSSSTSYVDGVLVASQKTISIDTGRGGILIPLKKGLRQRGWVVLSSSMGVKEQNENGKTVSHYGNTRYGFEYQWYRRDVNIFSGEPIIDFDASIIDHQTGREVISFSADYTAQDECVDKLLKLVDENTK